MLARLKGRDAGEGAAAAAEPEPEPEPELAPPAEGSYQLFVHVNGTTEFESILQHHRLRRSRGRDVRDLM